MTGRNAETEHMFAYHEATKHTPEALRRSPHWLDWANMPDPFRHYEGVPVVDLPADPPEPEIAMLDVLHGKAGARLPLTAAALLSQILFYSASISAIKRVPSTGSTYALRVNPSSGNLHPTEFHFATRGLTGWQDGLYHYRPSSHMAEQRATGDYVTPLGGHSSIVFVLTSIAWREAWKYRSRAYRYCLLDAGHAVESLTLAVRAAGFAASVRPQFVDAEIAEVLGVRDEWPMLVIDVDVPANAAFCSSAKTWHGGIPNRLSTEYVEYPLIDAMHAASSLDAMEGEAPAPPLSSYQAGATSTAAFAAIVRTRRSALDFEGGQASINREQLNALLSTIPQDGLVTLYAYVHRVGELNPGVYKVQPSFQLVKSGDQRVIAAALSLGQDLAGNACVAFSMIADLERCARLYGNRGYRYAHFEAGVIGQRLYLASEALGLRSTGIGAFYDDHVHNYLGIQPEEGQVVYHFATGFPVADDRLE